MTVDKSWEDLISLLATFCTVLQFLTGTLVCRGYIAKKSTGDTSGFPFIAGFLSCSMWLKYGLLTGERTLILVNTIGSCLFLSYIIVYYIFTVNKATVIRLFLLVSVVLICAYTYTKFSTNYEESIKTIGIVCCGIGVVFFASPLTMLAHVIRTRNSFSLPFPIISSSFVVALLWFIYGVLIEDRYVQIPNFLGCVLSGIQLLLFVIYPSKNPVSGPAYKPLEQSVIF